MDVWSLHISCAVLFPGILTAEEEELLQRVASSTRRERTRVAWAARRLLLSRVLDCRPADVVIARPARGAPTLDMPGRDLHFSLSHSGDTILFALSRHARVGADIERIDPTVRVDRVARRFYASAEANEILSLPPHDARVRFFQLWTRKEAVLKALGGGVPSRLRTVFLDPRGETCSLPFDGILWSLHEVPAPLGYAAAVAAEGDVVVHIHETIDAPSVERS